jgi:hypothetical protein
MSYPPAAMRAATAAAYMDISESKFRSLPIPAVTFNERGERLWLRSDIDAWLEDRRQLAVNGAKPKEQAI